MLANFDKLVNDLTLEDYQSMAGPGWPTFEQLKSRNSIPEFVINELVEMFGNTQLSQEKTKSFCVMPFYNLEIPENISCCLMSKNVDIKRVQQDMLNGIRPSECNHCWRLEDAGLISDRIIKNQTMDAYLKKDISLLFDQCQNNEHYIYQYKIDTSNTCNGICVTCGSYDSTAWAKLEKANGKAASLPWNLTINDIAKSIDFSMVKLIDFRGGESTLSKTNFDILERLIEHGNTDCFVSFVTNGSFNLSESQYKIISKFSNLNFCFSIDGIGPVFDYMRYPLKWNKTLSNLQYCKDRNISTSVSYTLSSLNSYYYDQTLDWFEENDLKYIVNPVREPTYFVASALSLPVKDIIVKNNLNYGIENFLFPHTDQCDLAFVKGKEEIAKQDRWKGISIADYLPGFSKLIK